MQRARAWAARDPAPALAWASSRPTAAEREQAWIAVCYGWAQRDPAAALDFVRDRRLAEYAPTVQEDIVQLWADRDLAAAFNWCETQPPGRDRERALVRVAFVWSETDPRGAVQLIAGESLSETERGEAVIMILHQWAQHDVASAMAWVAQFPAGPMRERAVDEIAGFPDGISPPATFEPGATLSGYRNLKTTL